MSRQKKNTVAVAEEIIRPVLADLGLELWDVRFEKEGSIWFLRYFIDKPDGVDINDCQAVSRAVDKLLDEADPIEQAYTLEVSSPGVERQLVRDAHFAQYMGCIVAVRLIRPVEGIRDFVGKLTAKDDEGIHLLLDEDDDGGVEMVFQKSEAAYIRLYVDFKTGGEQ